MADHTQFLSIIDDGEISEDRLQNYLHSHVLTGGQVKFLRDHNLTVIDVLNGRWLLSDRVVVLDWMKSVNDELGGKLFYPENC